MTIQATPVLSAQGICKSFGKAQVLKQVDFSILPGEVHALIGENGAGKSTLLKILFGIHNQDSGALCVEGRPVRLRSPSDAIGHGIAMIHQEPLVFRDLSVLENLFTGHVRSRVMDWRALERQAGARMREIGLDAPLSQKMTALSVAEQQLVEIGAALISDAKIIFMDEPTASLTPHEVENLLGIIRRLRGEGRSIVYISHRLDEIMAVADRVTVLRDGCVVDTRETAALTESEMIRLMLGRELCIDRRRAQRTFQGEPCLRVQDLGIPGVFRDVSFQVHRGEVLGIAGLMGAGRTEVARALFGITPAVRGRIEIDGREVRIRTPVDAVDHGIAMVPEDRQLLGLFLSQAIAFNATFVVPEQITRGPGWLDSTRETALTDRLCGSFKTKYSSPRQRVGELSGGNQQKVSLAKWIATDPQILILDEPTRGIDIGAKEEVYHIVEELAAQGKCVILISSELSELLALCDRVLVMYEGRPTATLPHGEISEMNILSAAHGYEETEEPA